ncbi:MAG: aminotransferase class V-fold PLP-dependent enzyme [Pseudomonadota bacterium]
MNTRDVPPPIYLDYAATTPVDPRVVEAMVQALEGTWANAASGHVLGTQARQAVEDARHEVAACLGAGADEIVFTSGATEAVNTAVAGVARAALARGTAHVVTTRIEHQATLDVCTQLEREGVEVTRLVPDADGLLPAQRLREALREDTCLVSLTHVNGEIGTVIDLPALAAVCSDHGVPLHVDAAQSAGKLPIDLTELPVDLLSISAHKLYGPKGAGALYVRKRPKRVLVQPLLFGGGQEGRLRSGTLATHQIVGLASALSLACAEREAEQARLAHLRDELWDRLRRLGGVHLNGHPKRRVGGHLSISIERVEGESLLLALEDLALSRGAACSALTGEPSYVLRALGRDDLLAGSTLRITLGRPTTAQEIEVAAGRIAEEVSRLRALAPAVRA